MIDVFSYFWLPAALGSHDFTAKGEAGRIAAPGILNQQTSLLPNNQHLHLKQVGRKLPRPSFPFKDGK